MQNSAEPSELAKPLCVDLDGTLVHSDSLEEATCSTLRRNLADIFRIPFWLFRGLSSLKLEIYSRSDTDAERLPYNFELIEELKKEKAKGRKLVLATGASQIFADKVNAHLELFDEVFGTQDRNLTGRNKAKRLIRSFGDKGFDYVGNSRVDLEVWKHASQAWVVGSPSLARSASSRCPVAKTFTAPVADFTVYRKALRVHQWAKNLLLFLPMLLAHRYGNATLWMQGAMAFFAFSMISSSVYLINDLLDIEADRRHPDNKNRPFAAGRLSVLNGVLLIPLLLTLGFGVGYNLSVEYFYVVLGYFVLTCLYSLRLKRVVMADIIVLASLYTWRVMAGGVATSTPLSDWFLTFALFFFLSLASLKRCSELILMDQAKEKQNIRRGYLVTDLPLLVAIGIASAFVSVLVLALYFNDHSVTSQLQHPELLAILCPMLLFWICRLWFKGYRGNLPTDPLVFALKDRPSYIIAVITGLVWLLSKGQGFISFKF